MREERLGSQPSRRRSGFCGIAWLVMGCVLAGWTLGRAHGAEPAGNSIESFLQRRGYQTIHLERDLANQFLIKGKINGAKAVFQVDTGSYCTLVDAPRATRLKRLDKDKTLRGAFGFEAKDLAIVVIESMNLDGTVVSNQLARVLDLHLDRDVSTSSRIPRSSPLNKKDVLLGLDFLSDTHALLDCGASALYLRGQEPAPQLQESMEESFKRGGFVCSPLDVSSGQLIVQGFVNGKEAHFLLDTGSPCTQLDRNQLDNFQIQHHELLGRLVDVGEHGTELGYAKLSSLRIGLYELKGFSVGLVDLGKIQPKKGENWPAVLGLIGPDLLGRARALIDCSSGKLYLKPVSVAPAQRQ